MGWTPPRRVYRIEPTSGPYKGLEARINGVPLGQFMALANLAESFDPEEAKGRSTREMMGEFAEIAKMFENLADALVEWNVELPPIGADPDSDYAEPVAPNLAGLYRLDFDLVMWMFGEWVTAMGGVSGPLGTTPSPGANSSGAASEQSLASLSRPLSPVPS
jgi:hypothetical protein